MQKKKVKKKKLKLENDLFCLELPKTCKEYYL